MMMRPGKVSGWVPPSSFNALVDYVDANTIRSNAQVKVSQTHNGLTLALPDKKVIDPDAPFRIEVGVNEIQVQVGSWTRNGTLCTFTPDASENYLTVSSPVGGGAFANSTTYIIYAQLEDSTGNYDPATAPDSVGIYADTSVPADLSPISGNIYMRLGTAVTDGSGFFSQPTQEQFGNIDDVAYIPDSNSAFATSGAEVRKYSLELCPTAGRLQFRRNLQILEWDAPTQATIVANDLLMFQDIGTTGTPLRYLTAENLTKYVSDNFDPSGGGGQIIGDWLNNNLYIKHTSLNYAEDDETELGVGRSLGSTNHDDVYWRAYDDSSLRTGHDAFIDGKEFRTTGKAWAGEIHVSPDGIADPQYWDATDLEVDLAGEADIDAVGNIYLDAQARGRLRGATGLELRSTGGSVSLSANVSEASVNAGTFVNLNPTGELQINGTAGITEADWLTKGIMTGTSIIEITADDLQPTDKILVVR